MRKIIGICCLVFFLVQGAGQSQAQEDLVQPLIQRIQGRDRYQTSVEISKVLFPEAKAPDESRSAVLVNGASFVDALAGNVLANASQGVILLSGQELLPPGVGSELARLQVDTIYLLGGHASLSQALEEDLGRTFSAQLVRIAGADRYETSEKVADEIGRLVEVKAYFLASQPADALAAASLTGDNQPLVLVHPQRRTAYFKGKKQERLVLGGQKSISQALYQALGASRRLAGSDRYESSLVLARLAGTRQAILANGDKLIDALAAGPLAFRSQAALVLSSGKALPPALEAYLLDQTQLTLVGGEESLAQDLLSAKEANPPSQDRTSFAYWDFYNDYSRDLLYSPEEIQEINRQNTEKSAYLIDPLDLDQDSYAYVARRTVVKKAPSARPSASFNDYQAETAFFPWDELAVLGQSSDGLWTRVQGYDYQGWVASQDLMLVTRQQIEVGRKRSFVTLVQGQYSLADGCLLDMGTYLPLEGEEEGAYQILMPVPGPHYQVQTWSLPKDQAVPGYLPFTQANIIRQALKFQGEPYGWGHSNSSRDCSGFVRDVYRSFGLRMARNTSQQVQDQVGQALDFSRAGSQEQREALLGQQAPGTALYLPGHVMLYLGRDHQGQPQVVHSYGAHYVRGKEVGVFKNAITSTSLQTQGGQTFLERVTSLRDFTRLGRP